MIGFKDTYDLEMAIRNDVIAKLFKSDYLPSYNFRVEREHGPVEPDPTGHIYRYQRDEAQLDWSAKIYMTNPRPSIGWNGYVGEYYSADARLVLLQGHAPELLGAFTKAFTDHDANTKVEMSGPTDPITYIERPIDLYDNEPSGDNSEVYCEACDMDHAEDDHSYCATCDNYHQNVDEWHMDDYWCSDCERFSLRDDDVEFWCSHIRERFGRTEEGENDE